MYFFVYGNKIYNFSVVNYEFVYLILFILFDYIKYLVFNYYGN